MALHLSRRGQFIAWVILYGGFVWLLSSKSANENLSYLFWGMLLGAGVATGTVGLRVEGRAKRFLWMLVWLSACYLLTFVLFGSEIHRNGSTLASLENAAALTLTCGFPALLALIVWVFRGGRA